MLLMLDDTDTTYMTRDKHHRLIQQNRDRQCDGMMMVGDRIETGLSRNARSEVGGWLKSSWLIKERAFHRRDTIADTGLRYSTVAIAMWRRGCTPLDDPLDDGNRSRKARA